MTGHLLVSIDPFYGRELTFFVRVDLFFTVFFFFLYFWFNNTFYTNTWDRKINLTSGESYITFIIIHDWIGECKVLYYAISSFATQYMLITLSMYRNINVEATKIVDIMQRRDNNYNRKLIRPATSAACIIPK